MENEARPKGSEPTDAAALIAEALKRKFAHRYRHDSGQEEKEDLKFPDPEGKRQTKTPLVSDVTVTALTTCERQMLILRCCLSQFGQHMLKPASKRKVL